MIDVDTRYCSKCHGAGKVHCSPCKGLERRIGKGARTLFWSKQSCISNVFNSIIETTPDIDLKMSIENHYNNKHLRKVVNKNNVMRRLEYIIERMNFEEITYTMGDNYINKRNNNLDLRNIFRFCQYLTLKGQQAIYENDYPVNCCVVIWR
ncbi:hypothetical protein I4U23_016932 [Adineta vaga]|nr:hypothetical protein I4U23_016932 [Adineta vaga]